MRLSLPATRLKKQKLNGFRNGALFENVANKCFVNRLGKTWYLFVYEFSTQNKVPYHPLLGS